MVVFGLCARNTNASSNYKQSTSTKLLNKSKGVLDELMNIGKDCIFRDNKIKNDFETSSFNLEEIMNRATKNTINYKDALINSLYSQVEFLKQEIVEKNKLITSVVNIAAENSKNSINIKTNKSNVNKPLYDSINSSVDFSHLASNMPTGGDERLSDQADSEFAAWEKHSKGFGSRIMKKMGYSGGGLGKDGKGIINPILISKKQGQRQIGEVLNNKPPNECQEHFQIENTKKPWPAKTTLITGSSIINGIEEHKLRKYRAKVRPFPGACVEDLYHYITPLLKKKPTNIILQIGSNDAPDKTADQIYDEIINLKHYIEDILPSAKIYLSCPVVRIDNSYANLVLRKLDVKLKFLSNIIKNDNVDVTCLGKRGLHLNQKGSARLAVNYISLMRRL